MSAATKRLRRAVFARADGACESCGRHVGEEAVSNCWALCLTCDVAKTANEPTAAFWLVAFGAHAEKHAYAVEVELAAAKLQTLHAKGGAA